MSSNLVCDPMGKKKHTDARGGRREGSGRKPLGEESLVPRSIGVSPSQWEIWRNAADAKDVSIAAWIRHVCDQAAEQDE